MRYDLAIEEPLNWLRGITKLVILLEQADSLIGIHCGKELVTHAVVAHNDAQCLRVAVLRELHRLLILLVNTSVGIHDLNDSIGLTDQKLVSLWGKNGSCEELAPLTATFLTL